ncbi:hypothetical protein B4168_3701 [Anoxybacillus flavithermus]|nr:hypothetical protein B4168_3701 [Anoxybacillus flavithermus]OAO88113.1 hypothetical protein GT23_0846 [Parageobacillus thermoglucosidasius]
MCCLRKCLAHMRRIRGRCTIGISNSDPVHYAVCIKVMVAQGSCCEKQFL